MREYPLWAFLINGDILITRGETQEQALEWASRDVSRGETIALLDWVPMYANYAYDVNHPFNWLYTPPKWVKEKERKARVHRLPEHKRKALKKAIGEVIENLKKTG